MSLTRIFGRDLVGTTHSLLRPRRRLHGVVLRGHLLVRAISSGPHLNTLPYIVALNLGGIVGSAFWGWCSQGRLGRRGAVDVRRRAGGGRLSVLPADAGSTHASARRAARRFRRPGMWGAFPSYLTERFPSEVRGAGAGFCYHAGALIGSFTSFGIGRMVDAGWALPDAMTASIAASGVAVGMLIWLGPETRGRTWT